MNKGYIYGAGYYLLAVIVFCSILLGYIPERYIDYASWFCLPAIGMTIFVVGVFAFLIFMLAMNAIINILTFKSPFDL